MSQIRYNPAQGRYVSVETDQSRQEQPVKKTEVEWAPGLAGQMPNCPGRGSPLRYGKNIVAIGGPTPTTIGAGASATLTWTITEAGHAGKLVLQETTAADLDSLYVTSIKYDNDELTSGNVPARMFAHDSTANPLFGHFFEVNHSLVVTIANASGGALDVAAAWNVLA